MRIPLGALALYEGQPGYDPLHPWWLPGAMHTDFECKALVQQGKPVDDLCVFAFHQGTPPYDYVRPSNVPSVVQVAINTPGDILGGGAETISHAAGKVGSGVGDGLASGLSLSGVMVFGVIALVGLGALFVYAKR